MKSFIIFAETKKKKIMEATINISKIITIISGNKVYRIKASELVSEISKFSKIEIKGFFSVSKFNKTIQSIESVGFSLSETWFKNFTENGKDVDFHLFYQK